MSLISGLLLTCIALAAASACYGWWRNQRLRGRLHAADAAQIQLQEYNAQLEDQIARANQMVLRTEWAHAEQMQIFNCAGDGMRIIDHDFNVLRINQTFARLSGVSPQDAVGAKCYDVFSCEHCHTHECPLVRIMDGEDRVEHEVQGIDLNGTLIPCLLTATRLMDPKMEQAGIVESFMDLTHRMRIEELLKEKLKAETACEAKSQFLANMSHEMRTPLNGVIGMAELFADTQLDENQRNLLQTIMTEAESLLALINQVLDYSKIEAGKLELERIPFDLRVTLEDLAAGAGTQAAQRGIEFVSYLSPRVPERMIGDPGRVRQILANLVSNALKFTHEGEISIKGDIIEEAADSVRVCFAVEDTGIGIPADQQDSIFDSFFQVDGGMTRSYGGTGLGTTIAKQLAEAMDGEIGLQSQVGRGTVFWVTMVFKRCREKLAPPERVDLSGQRILIVDDCETNRFIQAEYLKHCGAAITEAAHPREALALVRAALASASPYSLILTDFQMPGMTGFDLAIAIRDLEGSSRTPIIVITSAGRAGDARSCQQIGVDGYLTKPIRRAELLRAISFVLNPAAVPCAQAETSLVTRHTVAESFRRDAQILFVEDYRTNQLVGMRHLAEVGYQVDLAENGRLAVEAARRKTYDLILMDIQMPIMDGYEATRCIREAESSIAHKPPAARGLPHRVPIIAMTAHAIDGYREECLQAGMDDYITKPLWRKDLLRMVEKWLTAGGDVPADTLAADVADPGPDTAVVADALRANAAVDENYSRVNDESPPWDEARALEEFGEDRDFLAEVLSGFLAKVTDQIQVLKEAIDQGDADRIRREAHSIKGGAANLTAHALASVAEQLEDAGRESRLDMAAHLWPQLRDEHRRLDDCVCSRRLAHEDSDR